MEQRIAAGSDFAGELPTTEVAHGDSLEAYPEDTKGGLFDFDLTAPAFVRSLEIKLGGQSVWTVHKRDKEGDELLILCGDDETDFLTTLADSWILTAKQKLVVRTTGASTKMICRVSIQSPV
jgi:hypothetical protein